MKALALVAALSCSGCFTSWAITQAAGRADVLDEGVRESAVPIAGVTEQLHVRLPIAIEHEAAPYGAPPNAVGPVKPFALVCDVTQTGKDTVYHAAFRYGHSWKWVAGSFVLAEAATAAILYAADSTDTSAQIVASAFAVDALGTAVLALRPRKDVYRTEIRPDVTTVRDDCPDGLALAIGDTAYPVDAAGRLGEAGTAALDAWMRAPTAPLRATLAGQDQPLPIGDDEVCAWNAWHHGALCQRHAAGLDVAVTFAVPMGTLTRVD